MTVGTSDVSSDFFEVALLLGACFLVNYVTADAKTNWLEGFLLVAFYLMIVSLSLRVEEEKAMSVRYLTPK
jgi:Ca2+:H+ antiporter